MANIGGGNGDDTLNGTATADRINAGAGDDSVYGGGGSDILYGGSGDDYLNGGTGGDIITGGVGNDTMTGAEGQDVFRLWFQLNVSTPTGQDGAAGPAEVTLTGSEGHDVISDFDHRMGTGQNDRLDFNGIKAAQYDYLVATNQITFSHADYTGDNNTDMRIDYAGGSLTLSGVTTTKIADLDALKAFIDFDP